MEKNMSSMVKLMNFQELNQVMLSYKFKNSLMKSLRERVLI